MSIKVLLIVTGSVAAIKTYKLHSELLQALPAGSEVKIVCTKAAIHFLTSNAVEKPETPAAAAATTYLVDDDEWNNWNNRGDRVEHIELRKWADVAVVAPLCANTLAKIATGLCDNFATSILRAWEWKTKPVVLAPAMNTAMWEHPLTAPQLKTITSFGPRVSIVGPISKTLVCGDTGLGAMAEVADIVKAVLNVVVANNSDNNSNNGGGNDQRTRELICELCRSFYTLGWVSGTGGGISMKDPNTGKVLVAPSGVQKERIQPDDLFVLDPNDQTCIVQGPRSAAAAKLKQSECTPLFYNAYALRGAAACIHTHSRSVVLLSMKLPADADAFRITKIEMIKGIKKASTKIAHRYDEVLTVPIIENTNFERDLTSSMRAAMEKYPDAYCVIVRRHGCYIWGDTWEMAKTQAECYDYLFAAGFEMLCQGIPLV